VRNEKIITQIHDLIKVALKRKSINDAFVNIGVPNKISIQYILKEMNIDVSNFKFVIDEATIRHIYKEHGPGSKDEIELSIEDFNLLPQLVSNPDVIILGKHKTKIPRIVLAIKKNKDFVAVECIVEIRKGRMKLAVVTFYKKSL
jgi:uncharacterized radical SAM superfamily protein